MTDSLTPKIRSAKRLLYLAALKSKPTNTMNNTPRTDAAAWPETDVVEASFARQLERELIAVTKERDEYKLVLQSADSHNHEIATNLEIAREQLNEARDTIAMLTNTLRNNNDAARAGYEELKAELIAVTEQRDRLAENKHEKKERRCRPLGETICSTSFEL